jgi:hypothetical protein
MFGITTAFGDDFLKPNYLKYLWLLIALSEAPWQSWTYLLPIKLIGLGADSVKKSLFQNIQGPQALVCQVFGVCGCR